MDKLIPLIFVILASLFVYDLIKGILSLTQKDWGKEGLSFMKLVKHFKLGLISFALLLVFIIWVLPNIQ